MAETIVIVGGGIAGVSCIEALIQEFKKNFPRVILISETKLIKRVTNYNITGQNLEEFDVIEDDIDSFLNQKVPEGFQFEHIAGFVRCVSYRKRTLAVNCGSGRTKSERVVSFSRLCLCIGSKPKDLGIDLRSPELEQRVIVIRDTSTVEGLIGKIAKCDRIVIVGNGGIGLELVSKISRCKKFWIIRDDSVGLTFFDSGAGKFLLDSLNSRDCEGRTGGGSGQPGSMLTQSRLTGREASDKFGPALGPNWSQDFKIQGRGEESANDLDILYDDEVADISVSGDTNYPVIVSTKRGESIECDLVVVAIGVQPNSLEFIDDSPNLDELDGGILIDESMQTSLPEVYAAGDVVSCKLWPPSELWLQMRLWTQARQMGHYAGRCITARIFNEDPSIYFNFECFAHCTTFFGHKLVLLGQYNGQLLNTSDTDKCEVLARVIPDKEYVKILIKDGKIIGSVLVGSSGLEETIENLIRDGIDVSKVKNHLLDESVDIEDYFD